jgi:hypothetical protein
MIGASGCTRKVGYALVLEKEHIDAAEPTPAPVTTLSENATIPAAAESPTASPANEPIETELASDEIVVDTYVMKKNVRGTGKDPRASSQEKWLMKVEMVDDLRRFTILAKRAQFLKYKIGDRVRVSYKLGNYTGAVWNGEIEE